MTQAYLDPRNYTFTGGFTVQSKKDLIIPESLILSQTMLVKWQIRNLAKGVTIDQIPPALLSASLEIPGLGILEGDDHQIVPSQQGRDRVQLITLDPSLPHSLLFHQVSDLVTNSVIEFYTSNLNMATLNNPNQSLDLSEVVHAIQQGSAAEIAATQAAAATSSKQTKRFEELTYTTKFWDGVPANHIAAQPDNDRIGASIYNPYNNSELIVDLFADIANKTSKTQEDATIQPGGTYTLSREEANLGILLYTPNGWPLNEVHLNLEYLTPAAPAPAQ